MMLRTVLAGAASLAVIAFTGPATAQTFSGVYGNLGYTQLRVDEVGDGEDVEDFDIDFGAVTGRLGAKFHPNFGVEGELLVGVDDEEETSGDVTASLGVNYGAHVFAVGSIPVSERAELFARVGVGVTEIEAEVSGPGFSESESESGTTFAYGAGGQFFFDGVNGVRAEYTRYDGEDESAEADSVSLSYVRRF
jgi:outer membrane immunogenic protein